MFCLSAYHLEKDVSFVKWEGNLASLSSVAIFKEQFNLTFHPGTQYCVWVSNITVLWDYKTVVSVHFEFPERQSLCPEDAGTHQLPQEPTFSGGGEIMALSGPADALPVTSLT